MQGETLFISDLHLDSEYPEIQVQFLAFLDQDAKGSDALYILGDLFEVWLGDDDDNSDHRRTIDGLKQVSQHTPVFFQHGNRDFLLGNDFAMRSGGSIIGDPTVIDLYGQQIMLMHGDQLCTDDIAYQAFREQVRDPRWQSQFLQLPLAQRKQIARDLREKSRQETQGKTEAIMDVSQASVDQYMQQHGIQTLIHGHTHRPDIHTWIFEGEKRQRIVLGDWYSQGSVLRWKHDGYQLQTLARKQL